MNTLASKSCDNFRIGAFFALTYFAQALNFDVNNHRHIQINSCYPTTGGCLIFKVEDGRRGVYNDDFKRWQLGQRVDGECTFAQL